VPGQAGRWPLLDARYRGAPAVVRTVLEHGPRAGGIYMDPLLQVELPHWSRGRVALLGDAAHCLTLLSGQGASAAFSGASRLARALLAQADPALAFAEYESALKPLVTRLQPQVRAAAHWYVPGTPWRHWVRDTGMRMLPQAVFERHFRRKYRAA
jgi:2-polyprenyl-6-methoxyphenol hydroxylase-like FAD-dependent oxidoreductase